MAATLSLPPQSIALTKDPPAMPAPETESLTVPRLNYVTRVLPNGLTVYSVEDHRSPTVAIQVWYRVGSKDDPSGRSGFAHLFEHIMFKSTKNMPDEMLDRLTEDVGGENNAFTQDDVTVYHETVPSNHLETLLWAEADRMANLDVDARNFHSERSVVEEEYRATVLAPPYGRLDDAISRLSFTVHPYRRPTIGSIPDLDASSLAEVQAFHRTYYRPDNAVLVVVGDFDPAALNSYVDRYFGRIPRPQSPIPRVTAVEPPRVAGKMFTVTGPDVPLPAVAVTYLTPGIAAPDAAALRIANVILGSGESSRLYRSLIYTQQVASDMSSDADLRTDAGLFTAQATAARGKSVSRLSKALIAEVDKLRFTPPSESEIVKARNQLLSGALHERETVDGMASALGEAAVLRNDPERVNTDLAQLQTVTAADVQRVAATYFADNNRVEIRYTEGSASAALPSPVSLHANDEAGEAKKVEPSPARETAPLPGEPRPIFFPQPFEERLPNRLRVIVMPRPGTGLVTTELLVRAGSAQDPPGKAGLADFTASLLTKGTATRSAAQVAEEIEALGGALSSSAGWDGTSIVLSVLKTNVEPAFRTLSDIVVNPIFRSEDVTRRRAEEIDDFDVDIESPDALANYAAERALYGQAPYGHRIGGTPESLRALTRADIVAFHRAQYVPGNCVLVITGDIIPRDAFYLAQRRFGDWLPAAMPENAVHGGVAPDLPTNSVTGNPVIVIDSPDAGQAAVVVTRFGIARSDPDYHTALVANAVLGGGYSSRMNREVRVKRGLSYDAESRISARATVGPFYAFAQTKNASAGEVAALFLDEISGLASNPLADAELAARIASLHGDYVRHLETDDGVADAIATLVLYDRPVEELASYVPRIHAVTADQVKSFAARRLTADGAITVIVGDSRLFLPSLHSRFSQICVIPITKVDLNLDTLTRQKFTR